MRRRAALVGVWALPAFALAKEVTVLRLSGPSLVVLLDSPFEQEAQRAADPNYDEATGDFAVYTNRALAVLKGRKEFVVRWSSAQRVAFPGTRFSSVARSGVGGGWGYVFYKPGKEPVVIAGVVTEEELVCRASLVFEFKVEGYKCEA
jgi:hypothetical protein